jgi:signal transduction histidine kinase
VKRFDFLDLTGDAAPAIGSLSHAIRAAYDACTAIAAARTVGIVLDDVPNLEIAIATDRLALVLVNLIDNAVKHGRPGGGVDVADDRCVRISVDDDGPGICRRRPRAHLCARRTRHDRAERQRYRPSR